MINKLCKQDKRVVVLESTTVGTMYWLEELKTIALKDNYEPKLAM